MAQYKPQDNDLIFALDIGTRSIVGVVGRPEGDRLKVLGVEMAEHGRRTMLDGQIDDIKQVAALARSVTARLEERLKVRLQRVCVAAAGRALRTQHGTFSIELPTERSIDAELIGRLEAGAVSAAEEALQEDEEDRRQLFLVGYTVSQYRLDNYPLTNLLDHSGKRLEADVMATFLPGEVVESLYAAMRVAELQVASMTLEPIAAMNAAIPAELRLLNLALVDIGAGTTDIALCKEGSVVGYTMVTLAGDEITEAIMRAYLVDFKTAEQIKRGLGQTEEVVYRNILGREERVTADEVFGLIQEPAERLAQAIAQQILELNGTAPSALFLAGGGSKLSGLRERVSASLEMDDKRVAIAGNNFSMSVFAEGIELDNPEYATPLGIAVSAGLGLLNDSYVVLLNGQPAKLFRSGVLTLRDILLMNGYTYADMIGKTGKNLSFTLDGRHLVLRGEPAVPAVLTVNEEDASINTIIHAGDQIKFIPAQSGATPRKTLRQLLGPDFQGRALINNKEASLDTAVSQGDVILTLRTYTPPPAPAPVSPSAPVPVPAPVPAPATESAPAPEAGEEQEAKSAVAPKELHIFLNGSPLILPEKEDGTPHYLMDLLQHTEIDFEKLDRPVHLSVNGEEHGFRYELKEGDAATIRCI